jgi:hypothetical protein
VQQFPSLETVAISTEIVSAISVLIARTEDSDPRTGLDLDEDIEDFLARAKPSRKAKATPAIAATASGNRIPRPLLPAYQGLKRLEAIT